MADTELDEETPLLSTDEPVEPVEPATEEPVVEDEGLFLPEECDIEGEGGEDEGEDEDDDGGDNGLLGVQLTYKSAVILENQIHKKMTQHSLAYEYFQAIQFTYYTLPQATFTALSSVLAFAGGSQILANYATEISLIVGSLSAAVVLIQTIAGVKIYGIRSDRHNTAAIQLRDLHDDLGMIKLKLKEVEQLKQDKNYNSDIDGTPEPITFEQIEKRYRSSVSSCSSVLPIRIIEAFHGLDTNIAMMQTEENKARMCEMFPSWDYSTMFKSKAYDIMAGEFVNSRGFPRRLPNTKDLVAKTMERLKKRVKEGRDFYDDLDDP